MAKTKYEQRFGKTQTALKWQSLELAKLQPCVIYFHKNFKTTLLKKYRAQCRLNHIVLHNNEVVLQGW